MMNWRTSLVCCGTVLLLLAVNTSAYSQSQFTAEQLAFYQDEIQPILEENCYECHGGDEIESGFDMRSRAGLLAGGERGPALNPDDPSASLILEMLSYKDEQHQMPPSGKLLPWDMEPLRDWILMGAPYPPGAEPTVLPRKDESYELPPEAFTHWAYQPVRQPPVPEVSDARWRRNPIDAFIHARLEKVGLKPAPPASKEVLIRRAYYDLTGLPPTPEAVRAFVEDDSPDAYENLIEHLLASPHYGEKWGRHWLDLVRYADSNGYERDSDKPYMWRYRDYVIRSFNEDKPYDRFIREQLAGDELRDAGPEGIIATGYYRLGLWDDEPADRELARFDMLDDVVDTTSRVFLGTTLGCARCHDHKIDPIPQKDYYSFLAFFRGITMMKRIPGNGILESILDPFEQRVYDQRVKERKKELSEIRVERETIERNFLNDLVASGALSHEELLGLRKPDFETLVRDHESIFTLRASLDRYTFLKAEEERLKESRIPGEWAAAVQEVGPEPPETHVLIRGNPHVEGDRVEPRFPIVLSGEGPDLTAWTPTKNTAGRRRAIANWIASGDNPLTARVMVNRIWQHHFGRGIVKTPSDFGFQGARPTHPELLDWLAAEFVDRGWRIKDMHRLMMLSETYRMSSQGNTDGLEKDPANDLFWRFNMRRLTAEEVRDSLLHVSGHLNTEMYGPGFYPDLPEEALSTSSMAEALWGESPEEERRRRSVYIRVRRSILTPILKDFDLADTDSSCPVRFSTTQPTQALGMLNSAFVNAQAEAFAERLRREAGPVRANQVRLGLNLATQREPTADEVARGLDFIRESEKKDGLAPDEALERFCLVMFNLNEFMFVD